MKTKHTITAAVLALATACAQAAPYAITYTGTVALSGIPQVLDGQPYTVTLVMDNGGNIPASTNWVGANLTCVIWRMNSAGNAVFAQDATGANPLTIGQVITDAAGALAAVFTEVSFDQLAATPPAYKAQTGMAAVDAWFADDANPVFHLQGGGGSFSDADGGVQMTPARWSNPVPFTGNCLDAAGPASAGGGGIAPVPTLGHAALALLGALVGGLGLRLRRRNS